MYLWDMFCVLAEYNANESSIAVKKIASPQNVTFKSFLHQCEEARVEQQVLFTISRYIC